MSNSTMWQDYVAACAVLGSLDTEESRRRSEIEQRYSTAIANAKSGTTEVDESAAVSQALQDAKTALAEVFSMFDKSPKPISEGQSNVMFTAAAMQREAKDIEDWSAQAVARGRSLARTLSRIHAEEKRVAEDTVVATPAPAPAPAPAPKAAPKRGLILGLILVIILVGIVVAFLMMLF